LCGETTRGFGGASERAMVIAVEEGGGVLRFAAELQPARTTAKAASATASFVTPESWPKLR
jgi:hypothetical protein